MQNMNWNYPTTIWFGENRYKDIQEACNSINIQNPLIVTDPGLLNTDLIEKLNKSLKSQTKIYSHVLQAMRNIHLFF